MSLSFRNETNPSRKNNSSKGEGEAEEKEAAVTAGSKKVKTGQRTVKRWTAPGRGTAAKGRGRGRGRAKGQRTVVRSKSQSRANPEDQYAVNPHQYIEAFRTAVGRTRLEEAVVVNEAASRNPSWDFEHGPLYASTKHSSDRLTTNDLLELQEFQKERKQRLAKERRVISWKDLCSFVRKNGQRCGEGMYQICGLCQRSLCPAHARSICPHQFKKKKIETTPGNGKNLAKGSFKLLRLPAGLIDDRVQALSRPKKGTNPSPPPSPPRQTAHKKAERISKERAKAARPGYTIPRSVRKTRVTLEHDIDLDLSAPPYSDEEGDSDDDARAGGFPVRATTPQRRRIYASPPQRPKNDPDELLEFYSQPPPLRPVRDNARHPNSSAASVSSSSFASTRTRATVRRRSKPVSPSHGGNGVPGPNYYQSYTAPVLVLSPKYTSAAARRWADGILNDPKDTTFRGRFETMTQILYKKNSLLDLLRTWAHSQNRFLHTEILRKWRDVVVHNKLRLVFFVRWKLRVIKGQRMRAAQQALHRARLLKLGRRRERASLATKAKSNSSGEHAVQFELRRVCECTGLVHTRQCLAASLAASRDETDEPEFMAEQTRAEADAILLDSINNENRHAVHVPTGAVTAGQGRSSGLERTTTKPSAKPGAERGRGGVPPRRAQSAGATWGGHTRVHRQFMAKVISRLGGARASPSRTR
eukprot:INCI7906.1.p1 GENE.INCI7906.1~~INCI7906.1.p1  ORF type:complete len:700 (+),score=85.61 INCI7906.1:84-2183(+)